MRAPLAVRRGQELLYIYDSDMALQYLYGKGGDANVNEPIAAAATAATDIMNAVSLHFPDKHIKSLRDAIFHSRGYLDPQLRQQLEALNATYSFLRHMSSNEIAQLADRVAQTLSNRNDAPPSSESSTLQSHPSTPGLNVVVWQDENPQEKASCSTGHDSEANTADGEVLPGPRGDWRTLPVCAWGDIYKRFPRRPEAIASDLRPLVRSLRGASPDTAYAKYVELVIESFGDHFHSICSQRGAFQCRTWDELHRDFPKFVKSACYDQLCEKFDRGSKDPRHKSDEFLGLFSLVAEIWRSADPRMK